jgi:hypothetical protein
MALTCRFFGLTLYVQYDNLAIITAMKTDAHRTKSQFVKKVGSFFVF